MVKLPANPFSSRGVQRRPGSAGRVVLLGAGPGDPDLITWRGVQLLGEAEVVLHDALSHPDLLELCPQAELFDVGKRYGQRATAQDEITEKLIELSREGKYVVRLKGGDPLLFARGSEEALALAAAGVPFEIVPGVTSPVAASAFAGIPLTHRDLSSSVTFITGSDREGKEWSPDAWQKLATATGTICVYMGMRRIEAIAQAILDGGRARDTPCAVVRWGGRPQQRTITGTLENIAQLAFEHQMTSPAIIIVGEVVALREQLRWYDSRPLFGKKLVIPRPLSQAKATRHLVRRRAAIPLVAPAIEILPPPDRSGLTRAVSALSTYDWVIFTSANGVRAFFSEVHSQRRDARVFGAAKIAVIGSKTEEALMEFGVRADLIAEEYVAESLAEELLKVLSPGARILLCRAFVAREVLPETLKTAGMSVEIVPAYQTKAVEGEGREYLKTVLSEEGHVVLFTSSSMVDAVVDALGHEAKSVLGGLTIASIGPVTTKTLQEHGLTPNVEASVHTVDGVLDALEDHFESAGAS